MNTHCSNDYITMDWFAWLSKAGLDHSLVYEYGLTFAHNELEEEDITYFNHEFLQSMGISIAKHRLLIITLARKEKPSHSLWKLVSKTKKRFIKYIRAVIHRNSSTSALVVMPAGRKGVHSDRWRGGALLKRSQSKKLTMMKQRSMSMKQSLMLTNGSAAGYSTASSTATSTPIRVVPGAFPMIMNSAISTPRYYDEYGGDLGVDDDDDDDGYWSGVDQHQQQVIIKWDAMFQDLKPT